MKNSEIKKAKRLIRGVIRSLHENATDVDYSQPWTKASKVLKAQEDDLYGVLDLLREKESDKAAAAHHAMTGE